MKVKRYGDVDYSIDVPEEVYEHYLDETRRMAVHGSNGAAAVAHEIEHVHFRFKNLGRKAEAEMEIVARTQAAEAMDWN